MGKVYIIEPSNFVRNYLSVVIKKVGHQVTTVGNGKEALTKFKSVYPNTVIIDVDIPDCDAVQIIREIKKIDNDIKIIMTASHIDKNQVTEAIQNGVKEFLLKPYRTETLLGKIA